MAARLSHPNIATVHAIEETGDQTFIVMELVEGLDLKAVLENGGLPVEDALRIATGIARAPAPPMHMASFTATSKART